MEPKFSGLRHIEAINQPLRYQDVFNIVTNTKFATGVSEKYGKSTAAKFVHPIGSENKPILGRCL